MRWLNCCLRVIVRKHYRPCESCSNDYNIAEISKIQGTTDVTTMRSQWRYIETSLCLGAEQYDRLITSIFVLFVCTYTSNLGLSYELCFLWTRLNGFDHTHSSFEIKKMSPGLPQWTIPFLNTGMHYYMWYITIKIYLSPMPRSHSEFNKHVTLLNTFPSGNEFKAPSISKVNLHRNIGPQRLE